MKHDIFIQNNTTPLTWTPYQIAVPSSQSKAIVDYLESMGKRVYVFKTAKVLGKLVYETQTRE